MPQDNWGQAPPPAGFGLDDFDHAADGICVCHAIEEFPNIRFIFWNRRMVDLTGYTMAQINRRGWYQTVYPDPQIQDQAIARMTEMREGINLASEEWEITRADGEKRTLRISTSVLGQGDGKPRIMAIMHDITALKHNETRLDAKRQELKKALDDATLALQTSDAQYRNLFDHAGDAIIIHDLEGHVIDANRKALSLFEYTRPEILSLEIPKLHPAGALEKSKWAFEAVARDGHVQFETDFLSKNGVVIPAEVSSTLFKHGGQSVIQGIVRDIHARRLAEQARKETYDIIEKSPVTVFLWRNATDWPVEHVTRNVTGIFGYSDDDFLSGRIGYNAVVYRADLDRVSREVADATQDPECTEFDHEPYRIVTKDGAIRWVGDHTFIRRDHTGTVTHYQGIVKDTTDEREAADQLAAEKERLKITLLSIGDAVITTDQKGRIALMNPIAEHLTGWKESEAIGQPLLNVFRIINEHTREPCENPVQKVLATGQIVGLANHTMLIARDGREFIIADSGAPIRDSSDHIIGVVLVFRDTTERIRLEKELLKIEKLQSLGVLAGGIAHDFNNFLTGIIGNLSLAKLDIQPSHPISRSLNEMEKAAIRAKDLAQQLLTFSKGGDPVKQSVNLADLVRETALFAIRGSNVNCEFHFDEDLSPAHVDEGQIAQVIHNLIFNADHAMPDGGTILVEGANVSFSSENPYALTPGDYVRLSVRDQGTGIKSNHLKKVFDPYFTTKQKGSGLGLAVAYSIIAKHDGQLTVDSTIGHGTTFTILLPADANTRATTTEEPQKLTKGQGHILVMDDEDFIRELAQAMLEKIGYQVTLARDGQTAVRIYKEALDAGMPFDAVILDLTVPGGMGGKEAMRLLSALDPHLQAIVSSGYSNDPVMANYASYGFCGAVKKPYKIQELSQILQAAIEGRQP